eukprot:scaffold10278_cov113-Skeletonema_dohrnii-CCMP3373.AAC.3
MATKYPGHKRIVLFAFAWFDGRIIAAAGSEWGGRYLEQCTAVELKQTQALVNWSKINEATNPLDIHTLVKFLRKRIQCKCLDKKYKEVKDTTKLGFCYNTECTIQRTSRTRQNILLQSMPMYNLLFP